MSAGKLTPERTISLAYVCLSWCGTMRVGIPAAATDFGEVGAQLSDQGLLAVGTGQQPAIGRQGIERTEEAQALDEFTDKRVYRDHSFRLQLAERHVNRPTIRSRHCEGNHRRDRHIHRCAYRYGAAARRRWPADRCGGATPAGLIDPAVPSGRGADVEECAESPRDGSDEPTREAVQSRQVPPGCSADA